MALLRGSEVAQGLQHTRPAALRGEGCLGRKGRVWFTLDFVQASVKGLLKPEGFASSRRKGQQWGCDTGAAPTACMGSSRRYLPQFPAVQWRKAKLNRVAKGEQL